MTSRAKWRVREYYHRPLIQRETGLLIMGLQQNSLGGEGWGLQNIPDSSVLPFSSVNSWGIAFTVTSKTIELQEGIVREYDF